MDRDWANSRGHFVSFSPLSEFLSLHRRGKNSPLSHIAVHLGQGSNIARALNTFSHNDQSKSMRKINDTLTSEILFLAVGTTLDLTPIDLQLAERKGSHPL